MNWWFLLWLVLLLVCDTSPCFVNNKCHNTSNNQQLTTQPNTTLNEQFNCYSCISPEDKYLVSDAECCMEEVNDIFTYGNQQDSIKAIQSLEQVLERTEVNDTTSMSSGCLVAVLHKPISLFTGLEIYANTSQAQLGSVTDSKVIVKLPRELNAGPNNTIVFCMITWSEANETIWGAAVSMYEGRLVGLSVNGKNVSGLKQHVSITTNVTTAINETQEPRCVFLNFSTQNYSSDGCLTLWKRGQHNITCSCDHLTYFGVLLVDSTLSSEDQKVLSYITLTGCSLSLSGLVMTVLLFIKYRKVRADVSMKVHISLAVALLFLNVHLLFSHLVAQTSFTGPCIYMALALHYSLLATFSWMALEGFHLYILLVRVFNIYIRRYLLKLSLVGWGIPAVVVSIVAIIDRTAYGQASLDPSNPNGTTICYITNETVKLVSTLGVFCLVFFFNVIMLGVTVRRVVITLRQFQEFGQSNRERSKQVILTLLGITTLLGIPWGVVFFSLTTAGQYIFCILSSLQGFFIFLWFVMSLRKAGKSAPEMSTSELKPRQ